MRILATLFFFALAATLGGTPACWASCSAQLPCDKCAKSSEFSWNPANQDTPLRLEHFYAVGDQLTAAYDSGDFDKAKQLAGENLALAAIYRCNWNYGNAIHDSNRVLGLISLKANDLDAASDYLRKAGETTGSPQLDSFGPELDLANQLLQRGRSAAVRSYLLDIKRFWTEDDGNIERWVAAIDRGEKPQLDRFTARPLGIRDYFLAAFSTLWPAIVPAVFLVLRRKRLSRRLAFFALATVIGYAATMACGLVMGYFNTPMLLAIAELGLPPELAISIPVVFLMSLPIAATFLVARYFRQMPPAALATP